MEALMTPEQVADRLQLAPRTIYLWLRQGRLRGIKLGSRWRVKREDLDAYLERQRPAAGNRPDSEGAEEAFDVMGWIRAAEEAMREVPEEEWARIPPDLCDNLDHYLYGLPKREMKG